MFSLRQVSNINPIYYPSTIITYFHFVDTNIILIITFYNNFVIPNMRAAIYKLPRNIWNKFLLIAIYVNKVVGLFQVIHNLNRLIPWELLSNYTRVFWLDLNNLIVKNWNSENLKVQGKPFRWAKYIYI